MRAAFMSGLALASAALSGCGSEPAPAPRAPAGVVGYAGTLPIVWAESDSIADMVASDAPAPHWALGVLREAGRVEPLATLSPADGALPLPAGALLLLAQPRAFTAQENVALDDWVRGGGRVLAFVDPLLTAPSRFAPGDPRRPQDVAMLSPILARWGLELTYDPDDQAMEAASVGVGADSARVPLAQSGRWRGKVGSEGAACAIDSPGVLARCRIGRGRAVLLADAALLDSPDPEAPPAAIEAQKAALRTLVSLALTPSGD